MVQYEYIGDGSVRAHFHKNEYRYTFYDIIVTLHSNNNIFQK